MITIVKFDDGGWEHWEGMYLDGRLVYDGCYISLEAFIKHCGVDLNVTTKTIMDSPDNNNIPDTLEEAERLEQG